MASYTSSEARGQGREPNHLRRVGLLWLIASAIATPLVVLLLGPIVPPGNASVEAHGQVTDNTVLLDLEHLFGSHRYHERRASAGGG